MQYLAETIFRVEADSEFALGSLPEPECGSLACDSQGRVVVIIAAVALLACLSCVAWNNIAYFVAEHTPGLPRALRVRPPAVCPLTKAQLLTSIDNLLWHMYGADLPATTRHGQEGAQLANTECSAHLRPHAHREMVQELAEQQRRILTKEENLYIQQLAPKAYISPLFTRQQLDAGHAPGTL